jgi:hypothetical protein
MKHSITHNLGKHCFLLGILCLATTAQAQLTTTNGEGDSVRTPLGYNVVLNDKSTLKRQWITINDPNSPAELESGTNVTVQYEKDYFYRSNVGVKGRQPLTAVELVHVIVDVFGRQISTLRKVELADIANQELRYVSGKWRIWSEAEAALAHTSYTYVRAARTADGKVYSAPIDQVLNIIRKAAPALTATDIEPPKAEQK